MKLLVTKSYLAQLVTLGGYPMRQHLIKSAMYFQILLFTNFRNLSTQLATTGGQKNRITRYETDRNCDFTFTISGNPLQVFILFAKIN